jgi:hypothetical protein
MVILRCKETNHCLFLLIFLFLVIIVILPLIVIFDILGVVLFMRIDSVLHVIGAIVLCLFLLCRLYCRG